MRKGCTVLAAFVATAIVATPLVMGAGKALATSETGAVAKPVAVLRVEAAPAAAEPCLRKVRVVYGAAPAACATAAR